MPRLRWAAASRGRVNASSMFRRLLRCRRSAHHRHHYAISRPNGAACAIAVPSSARPPVAFRLRALSRRAFGRLALDKSLPAGGRRRSWRQLELKATSVEPLGWNNPRTGARAIVARTLHSPRGVKTSFAFASVAARPSHRSSVSRADPLRRTDRDAAARDRGG